MSTHKNIEISGQHNRYQVKKVLKQTGVVKDRVSYEKWDVDERWFNNTDQIQLVSNNNELVVNEINVKLSAYKQQDILKNRLDETMFIDYEHTKTMLVNDRMTCYYCRGDVYILYKRARDMSQWSLDRINNSLGHNVDNVVISCLKCNLERKTRDATKFRDSKQMVVVRKDHGDTA